MGAPQWSTTNVAYLTVVAVVSCLVGYFGTVYLNTPVSTVLYTAPTVVRPSAVRAMPINSQVGDEIAQRPQYQAQFGAATAGVMTAMTPAMAQATEITGGSIPTPVLYVVSVAAAAGFIIAVFIAMKSAKLMN